MDSIVGLYPKRNNGDWTNNRNNISPFIDPNPVFNYFIPVS